MTHITSHELRKMIPSEEFDYPLLTSVLSPYQDARRKINELLKAEIIIRVKKGLYVFGPEYNLAPVCKELLANLIYGPSYISLEYALAFHGLIPERVETLTSVTPQRDKRFETPLGRFTYKYLAIEKYSHEIQQVMLDQTHPVLMASAEKALCDYVVVNKIRHITSPDQARDFLESDLRIDEQKWRKLSSESLTRTNDIYRNEAIQWILEAL